ncbi:unnamed protein product, partial [Heterosigma akashiwo]
ALRPGQPRQRAAQQVAEQPREVQHLLDVVPVRGGHVGEERGREDAGEHGQVQGHAALVDGVRNVPPVLLARALVPRGQPALLGQLLAQRRHAVGARGLPAGAGHQ